MHLGVSLRSFRAEKLSSFVHALLDVDEKAASIYAEIKDKYPIVLTRDMEKAKRWLHTKAKGTERTGVLLTRARSGMIICVPAGNGNKSTSGFWEDSTRLPEYYDGTYQYLKNLGIEEI